MKKRYPTFEEHLDEKKSGKLFKPKRDKVVDFDAQKGDDELEKEFFELIATAYAPIGGHLKVQKAKDVFADSKVNYWQGVDLHDTDDFDIIMFGKKTKYGVKFTGIGHDGEKDSKRAYLDSRGKELRKGGFYIEVSGKIADILAGKYQVPVVTDEETVRKVLGKDIIWDEANDGWYTRKIGTKRIRKIMMGNPRI
jgi:hypothetical protein